MISASHNPYEDNGIKLFGPDGFKLSDEDELAIEAMLGQALPLADSPQIGRARRIEDARGRYIHAVKGSVPHNIRLDGLKSSSIAPMARPIRWPLGGLGTGRGSDRHRRVAQWQEHQ
jgi:phosphomannomutase